MTVPTRWIIACRPGLSPDEARLRRAGWRVLDRHEHEGGACLLVEAAPAAEDLRPLLRDDPAVAYVEPDQTVGLPRSPLPDPVRAPPGTRGRRGSR